MNEAEVSLAQQEDVVVAKRMFLGGCACLPWLWIMNLIYYRHAIFNEDAPEELRKWLRRSLVGAVIAVLLLTTWIAVFQTQHDKWGDVGEKLLVFRPTDEWWRRPPPQ